MRKESLVIADELLPRDTFVGRSISWPLLLEISSIYYSSLRCISKKFTNHQALHVNPQCPQYGFRVDLPFANTSLIFHKAATKAREYRSVPPSISSPVAPNPQLWLSSQPYLLLLSTEMCFSASPLGTKCELTTHPVRCVSQL